MKSIVDIPSLRKTLGQFATGVAVASSTDMLSAPVGLTINSFSSVSLDPPLVLWSLRTESFYYPVFKRSQSFSISVLSKGQKDLCKLFAGSEKEKFSHVDYFLGDLGSPILNGSIAYLECSKRFEYDAGDHVILVGEVVNHGIQSEGEPLVFHGGAFCTVGG